MVINDKVCLITNDVETTSLINHKLSKKTGEYVLKQGMPRLLNLYDKYNIKSTFFFTAHIAKLYPEVVKMIIPYGHEVASHGYNHEVKNSFDILPYNKQVDHLKKSKKILEDISGNEVTSFRAPAARVSKNTSRALVETGFKIDSSVSSQRLDMFFSFGVYNKLNWLTAPRLPYYTKIDNIFKKGNSNLLEIPITSFIFPYIGTFMRIFPTINRINRNILYLETLINNRPFVFLTHPNEFIDEKKFNNKIISRTNNPISYLFGDYLRYHLKIKNLGKKGLPIYDKELKFFKKNKFKFMTFNQYINNGK